MHLRDAPCRAVGLECVLNQLGKLGISPKYGHLVLELSRVIEERAGDSPGFRGDVF